MSDTEIIKMLKTSEYDFLRTNKYLGDNIILLALGGSKAYGLSTPTSDTDIRGIAINPSSQIYGLEKDFEQVVETNTDTVIYSINKMVKLLTECNPNTIEILGCRPEDYLYIHELGQLVLNNKENFLSKKAIDTFGGYANAQYNRLEHALLNNGENNEKKLDMLLHSLNCALNAFNAKHQHSKSNIRIRILSVNEYEEVIKQRYIKEISFENRNLTDKLNSIAMNGLLSEEEKASKVQSATDLHRNNIDDWDYWLAEKLEHAEDAINERIVIDGDFSQYPVGDIQTLLRDFHKIKSEYGNINKRNHKKDAIHMAKHMTHLIRLYKMGTKLNESMEIHTYWDGKDQEELMYIRLGNFMTGDGMKVRSEFFDYHKEVQDKYNYSVKHTVLPDKPNIAALNSMLFKVYTKSYHMDGK